MQHWKWTNFNLNKFIGKWDLGTLLFLFPFLFLQVAYVNPGIENSNMCSLRQMSESHYIELQIPRKSQGQKTPEEEGGKVVQTFSYANASSEWLEKIVLSFCFHCEKSGLCRYFNRLRVRGCNTKGFSIQILCSLLGRTNLICKWNCFLYLKSLYERYIEFFPSSTMFYTNMTECGLLLLNLWAHGIWHQL